MGILAGVRMKSISIVKDILTQATSRDTVVVVADVSTAMIRKTTLFLLT